MSNMKKHIELLGMKAKDRVSGLTGIITSISFDLYGCIQAALTPAARKGEYMTGSWLDLNRLEISSDERVMDAPDFENINVSLTEKGAADKPSK